MNETEEDSLNELKSTLGLEIILKFGLVGDSSNILHFNHSRFLNTV